MKFLPQRRKEKTHKAEKKSTFAVSDSEFTNSKMDLFILNVLDLKPSFSFHQISIRRIFEELFRKEIFLVFILLTTGGSPRLIIKVPVSSSNHKIRSNTV